ncbi:MAG: site-specific DNA-methyltransferase, partial [Mangrovibacterium sp.]
KVKMIYIDPPYNTGKDFVYRDNFTQDAAEYAEESGQVDEYGIRMQVNPDTAGRYHSDWLSMMYPRLKLARNLLTEDGVIFISIGVEEIANLKRVLNEIFGESNFIEVFSWVKTSTPPALSTKSRKTNEYILCYEKSWNSLKYNGELLDGGDQPLLNSGNSTRTLKFPKDKVLFKIDKFSDGLFKAGKPDRVELLDDIVIKSGYSTTDFCLSGEFKWTQEFLETELEKGTTFIIKSEKLSIRFIRNEDGYKRPTNFIKEKYTDPTITKKKDGVGTNENASSYLSELMGSDVFSYPKPISLMKHLFNFIAQDGDIVLDFFSGSASAAEGVLQWSVENENNLKFIMVQLPENLDENLKTADSNSKIVIQNGINLLDKLGKPHLLTELGKERIRRAANKIKAEHSPKAGEIAFEETEQTLDLGFRVYRLDSSNMEDIYYRPQDIRPNLLDQLVDNVKPDRSADDLLAQIMLDWGLPLSLPIERTEVHGKQVFKVAGNSLYACFDNGIDEEFAKTIAAEHPLRIVFKDASFAHDTAKINVQQLLKQLSAETEMKVL